MFPEQRHKAPQHTPEKDKGLNCTTVMCIEPSSPTPLLTFPIDLGENERGHERDVERREVRIIADREGVGQETEFPAGNNL